jgi:hypothetical protein
VVITRLPPTRLGRRWVTNPGGERRSILAHACVLVNAPVRRGIWWVLRKIFKWEAT